MANREVNLTKRIKTPQGWRFCPVILAPNGRLRSDVVLVGGNEEKHPEGAFYLEWREGSKRIRLSVGKNAADAVTKKLRKAAALNAQNNGLTLATEGAKNGHRPLASSVIAYLADVKLTHKPRSYAAYATALAYFLESCKKVN